MFSFGFFDRNDGPGPDSISCILSKIKEGDKELQNKFIEDNKHYILKIVSKTIKKYFFLENCEEYSVALSAFNEAIETYDYKKNDNFFKYSEMVIQRRIIDHKRKHKRHQEVLSLSYLQEQKQYPPNMLISDSHYLYEKVELKEELGIFEKQLNEFGISVYDLVSHSPKHKDARLLAIQIASLIAENEELYGKLIRKKMVPLLDLQKHIKVSTKTIERNRKFIIAVSIILRSNMDQLKGFIGQFGKEGSLGADRNYYKGR